MTTSGDAMGDHMLDIHRKCRREREELEAKLAEAGRCIVQEIEERDEYHDVADKLAAAIEKLTGQKIGDHSSMNDPWDNALVFAADALAAAGRDDPSRVGVSGRTSGEDGADVGAICDCAVAEHDGHRASEHTDCGGGHPPCGGCHSCLLRQMHHAKRLADREQWSVPCPTCHMPAGKACVDAAGPLPEHMNHADRAKRYAEAVSGAGQAGEEVTG